MANQVFNAHKYRLVEKLYNGFMRHGHKSKSRSIVNKAFEKIAETTQTRPEYVYMAALAEISPPMGQQKVRKGGSKIRVPLPITEVQRQNLAIKWLVTHCQNLKTRLSKAEVIADEIIKASKGEGALVEKRIKYSKELENARASIFLRYA